MTQHPEHQLQRACVQYLRTLPPPPRGPYWTAIAPLPGTSARQGAQAKALGLQAGAPDLILLWNGVLCGIELKAALTGRVKPAQDATWRAIENAGGIYYIVRSLNDFSDAIDRLRNRRAAGQVAA